MPEREKRRQSWLVMPSDRASAERCPAMCPACKAKSEAEAAKSCIPVEGQCPIVEAGFWRLGEWPTQAEFEARRKRG